MKPKADKRECLKRDLICRVCGEDKLSLLTLHHIFPKGHKDRDKLWAKTILCKKCHRHINQIWNKQ